MSHRVNEAVERFQANTIRQERGLEADDDVDKLLEDIENEDDEEYELREKRIQELKSHFGAISHAASTRAGALGTINDSLTEEEVMQRVARDSAALIFFHQPQYARCQTMRSKLTVVAEKHVELQIYSLEATRAPFLVSKLSVKVLPCLVMYRNGENVGRIVGFEGLSFDKEQRTIDVGVLEARLYGAGVVARRTQDWGVTQGVSESDDDCDSLV